MYDRRWRSPAESAAGVGGFMLVAAARFRVARRACRDGAGCGCLGEGEALVGLWVNGEVGELAGLPSGQRPSPLPEGVRAWG